MTMTMIFNMMNNVRHYRTLKNWTQFRLANNSGVHPSDISKIEKGVLLPGEGVKVKLAIALGVDINQLFPMV